MIELFLLIYLIGFLLFLVFLTIVVNTANAISEDLVRKHFELEEDENGFTVVLIYSLLWPFAIIGFIWMLVNER